jgi:hypothetical protein
VLAGESQMDGGIGRHEMLHALLFGGGHPRGLFLETCGGIVACNDACIDDAGPPPVPPFGTVHVPPDSIELGLEIQPPSPGGATLGGYFTLTVTAHNRAPHPVVVLLPPSGDAGPSGSFRWSLSGQSSAIYDDRAYDPGVAYFAAGEIKRDVFDQFVGSRTDEFGHMAPGDYIAVGGYGGHSSASVHVSLAP